MLKLKAISSIISFSLIKLLSPRCISCGLTTQKIALLCEICEDKLPHLPKHCQICANALPLDPQANMLCTTCQAKPPPYHKIWPIYPYEPPITPWISQLKFNGKLIYASLFASQLLKQIQNDWYQDSALPDLIIPIPLHLLRLQQRGFNQALEIARPVAKKLKIQIDPFSTIRIKATQPQTSLSAKERAQNLKHAFHCKRDLTGLHIGVVDDVVTTGHTINTFCQLLKSHGAKQIDVWCVAKRI